MIWLLSFRDNKLFLSTFLAEGAYVEAWPLSQSLKTTARNVAVSSMLQVIFVARNIVAVNCTPPNVGVVRCRVGEENNGDLDSDHVGRTYAAWNAAD